MAWNEPGKDNDPWNNPNRRKGGKPNDLDQIIKDASNKISGIFGGKGGGSKSSNGGDGRGMVIGVLVLAVLGWALLSFYTVKEAERGVITRFGAYHRIATPGLVWAPLGIDRVVKVDVNTVENNNYKGSMLTKDRNIVDVELSVQYRINEPEKYLFNVSEPLIALNNVTDAALRHVIGNSLIDDVLKDRKAAIMDEIREEMMNIMTDYDMGLTIVEVNLQNSEAPREVRDAFDDVTKSKNDKEKLIEEARAYSNQLIPAAEGTAARMLQEAEAYKQELVARSRGEVARFEKLLPEYEAAPVVTRQRFYIEAMEEVMQNVSKVIIDTKDGNNLTYLPLDKIISQERRPAPRKDQGGSQ